MDRARAVALPRRWRCCRRVGNGTVKIRLLCTVLRARRPPIHWLIAFSLSLSLSLLCLWIVPQPAASAKKSPYLSSFLQTNLASAGQADNKRKKRFSSLSLSLSFSLFLSSALLLQIDSDAVSVSQSGPFVFFGASSAACVFLWPISDRFNWRRLQEICRRR